MHIELLAGEQDVLDTALRHYIASVKNGAVGTMKQDEAIARSILARLSEQYQASSASSDRYAA